MGQYYTAAIRNPALENKDFIAIEPHKMFKNPSKLTESAWWGNPYVNAVFSLLKDVPLQVAWMGDYSEESYNDFSRPISSEEYAEAYSVTNGEKCEQTEQITDKDFALTEEEYSELLKKKVNDIPYFVNLTKKEYIDLRTYYKYCVKDDWCVHPLPLLTACGNGQGGGDYYGPDKDMVGSWAFDTLAWLDKLPEGDYKAITPNFNEEEVVSA